MNEPYSTRDRRGLVWLNEIGVLRALAHNMNEPMYVGQIALAGPDIWRLPKAKLKMFTRPGITAACLRLEKRGILRKALGPTPNKRKMTPHYRIDATLAVLASIHSEYGTGILDDIRSASFGQNTIAADLDNWLRAKLRYERELRGIASADDLKMIMEFASISTLALEVLLSDKIPLYQYQEKSPAERMPLQVRHLRMMMHFAAAFDIAKRSAVQLVDESLMAEMSLVTKITIGSQTLSPRSEYRSEEISGRQRALIKKEREKRGAGKPKRPGISGKAVDNNQVQGRIGAAHATEKAQALGKEG